MLLSLFKLLLLNELVLYHPFNVLRVVLCDISDTLATCSHESLKCKIVASGQGIVLIGFNEATGIFPCSLIKGILVEYDL